MLQLTIEPFETYIAINGDEPQFINTTETIVVEMEHSLLAISKWESIWHKPFLITNHSQEQHTPEEMISYFQCMITNNANPIVVYGFRDPELLTIKNYIENPMTATVITHGEKKDNKSSKNIRKTGKIITSELIYYWLSASQIPFIPCENWHINRVLTLIDVASEENNPDKKKMSKNDILKSNHKLNAARRAKFNTKG